MPRLALRVAAILAGLIFCVALHYLWKLFRARPIWPQIFLGYAGACCGLRVTVDGKPIKNKVLVAANHVSWLDILALGGAAPVNFVARGDVAGWPVVGWAASLNDTIFVDRDARSSVAARPTRCATRLRRGVPSASFPRARPTAAPAYSRSARACSPRSSRRSTASRCSRSRWIMAQRPATWPGSATSRLAPMRSGSSRGPA
jgi:1-acyl-sn-glycerol-3-phosphate acyltransferase